MKKVLLLSLFGVFAYANNPVKEEPKEIERLATSVCQSKSYSGVINGNQTSFTTICCVTLADGHSDIDYVSAINSTCICAEEKYFAVIGILAVED